MWVFISVTLYPGIIHIEYIEKRLRLVHVCMYITRSICDVPLRKAVYRVLGESIIRHGLTVYGSASS